MPKTAVDAKSLRRHQVVFYVLAFLLAVAAAMLVVQLYENHNANQPKHSTVTPPVIEN